MPVFIPINAISLDAKFVVVNVSFSSILEAVDCYQVDCLVGQGLDISRTLNYDLVRTKGDGLASHVQRANNAAWASDIHQVKRPPGRVVHYRIRVVLLPKRARKSACD